MKSCFKCHISKPIDQFYKHPKMKDGHLNKCKECTRRDTHQNYEENREAHSSYDKLRQRRVDRRQKKQGYLRRHRLIYPERDKARQAVARALRFGRLRKEPCLICGTIENLQAHHEDYDKPLEVKWYCDKHHRTTVHGKQA